MRVMPETVQGWRCQSCGELRLAFPAPDDEPCCVESDEPRGRRHE